ncbi:septal ring lytic transglycosylase RlpA family protein [Cyclonatronum proteinivorum]|nr:septal ring lytic transglycosylase RlpA family protein [Cyclonatronum proteinivorum]
MNLRITLLFFFLGMMVLSGCRSQRDTVRTGTVFERGEASWYGPGFHGQATANGERYDQEALTAAHRTLPFDTVVGVRNLHNGKKVVVRINDRGPYANNRIIDLSRAAAREIDMIQSGIAPVELTILRSPVPVQRAAIARELFTVQVASFNTRQEATAHARSIRGARVAEGRVQGQTVYRVYVGEFRNQRDAERQRRRLSRQGINGFVKQVQN